MTIFLASDSGDEIVSKDMVLTPTGNPIPEKHRGKRSAQPFSHAIA
ncbi:hypothetical protein PQQ51_23260 [Paraburkholderia xenovorans]